MKRLILCLGLLCAYPTFAQQNIYSTSELKALHHREYMVSEQAMGDAQHSLLSHVTQQVNRYKNEARKMNTSSLKMIPHSEGVTADSNVFAFTSLSVPKQMFNQLAVQATKYQIPLYIRGFLKSGMRATVTEISHRLMKQDHKALLGGVAIDPRRFKQFGITHVPAFVVVRKGACLDTKKACPEKDFDVLTGSVSLSNALDLLAKQGRFKKQLKQVQQGVSS